MTRIMVMIAVCCFSLFGAVSAQEIIGTPKQYSVEGSHNGVYYRSTIYGSGATCWIQINCGSSVSILQSSLRVTRSKGLWIPYDVYTVNNMAGNSTTVFSRWDDGGSFVALDASGTTSMNGTVVESLSVDGWW